MQLLRAVAIGRRTHADCQQAVAEPEHRWRREGQLYEVQRQQTVRTAISTAPLTASLWLELTVPTPKGNSPSCSLRPEAADQTRKQAPADAEARVSAVVDQMTASGTVLETAGYVRPREVLRRNPSPLCRARGQVVPQRKARDDPASTSRSRMSKVARRKSTSLSIAARCSWTATWQMVSASQRLFPSSNRSAGARSSASRS